MRLLLSVSAIVLFIQVLSYPADRVRVYYLKAGEHEYVFYAENENYCPYQIMVYLKNADTLCTSSHVPYYAKLKPMEKGLYLFSVITMQDPSNSLDYTVQEEMGDPESVPDTNYIYFIPYEEGTAHMVNQGYYEKGKRNFSHRGWISYSIDFGMNIGTPICAAREGIVVDVKQDSGSGGLRFRFMNMANYIAIYHKDGTIGEYVHLTKNGSLVKVGDIIKKGQIIGYSGNTGFTGGPHLHFMVVKPLYMFRVTIPTLFKGNNNAIVDPGHNRRRFFVSNHHENYEFYAGSSTTNEIPLTSGSASTNTDASDTSLGGL